MTRTIAWAAVLGLALTGGAAGGADWWTAAGQPDVAKKLTAAPALAVEDVCVPVRSTRRGLLLEAPNPDGKSYDLLQIYFEKYGGPNTIVIMDLGSGEVKQVTVPRDPHRYQFHLCPSVVAPNGKLYISVTATRGRQKICLYDPATNDLAIDALDMPDDLLGETHPMKLGTDGMIYCAGGHPSKAASACQIDPATNRVTSYGPIGPSHAPSDCWGYSLAADGRYVYVASGKVPWYLVAYDRQRKTSKVLAETEKVDGYVSVGQGRFGCTARVTKQVGVKAEQMDYWLHEGRLIERTGPNDRPPWPEPKDAPLLAPAPPQPGVITAGAEADLEGNAEIWYRSPEAAALAPAKPAADASLASLGWKVIRYKVPIYPQDIYRVVELPDGRIFGTAGAYEGNFLYDPKTDRSEHLGKSSLSHYATALHDGKVYMSGYPTSPVYVYDPARPWTALSRISETRRMREDDAQSNPRMVARLTASGAHKMYAATVGADGRVYFGGRWYRNGSGGGLGWWDPKAQQAGGIWKTFSNYQINFMTAACEGKVLVISAHRVTDTVLDKPKPEQGALFFFDTAAGEIAGKLEVVAKAKGPGPIVCVGGPRVLGWTENPEDANTSILYSVDAAKREVTSRKTIPFRLPIAIGSNQSERWDYRLGPDGMVWTFLDDHLLVRIDPADASIRPVGKVDRAGRIAFSGGDVYLSGTEKLRRIKGAGNRE